MRIFEKSSGGGFWSFPIPMRGNESHVSGAAVSQCGQGFPIPMRGNEDVDPPADLLSLCEFPIPMRGNERKTGLPLMRVCFDAFPNPHEG